MQIGLRREPWDTDTFGTEFCKVVQDDSDVASKALLWTFDPNPAGNGNAVHKPGPNVQYAHHHVLDQREEVPCRAHRARPAQPEHQ